VKFLKGLKGVFTSEDRRVVDLGDESILDLGSRSFWKFCEELRTSGVRNCTMEERTIVQFIRSDIKTVGWLVTLSWTSWEYVWENGLVVK